MKYIITMLFLVFSNLSYADRIDGYQDFKLGMSQADAEKVISNVCGQMARAADGVAGAYCYNIFGMKRSVEVVTNNGKVIMLNVYMGMYSQVPMEDLVYEMSKKYGPPTYLASAKYIMLANEGMRQGATLVAFKDFSIFIRANHKREVRIIYTNDEYAMKQKQLVMSEDPDYGAGTKASKF